MVYISEVNDGRKNAERKFLLSVFTMQEMKPYPDEKELQSWCRSLYPDVNPGFHSARTIEIVAHPGNPLKGNDDSGSAAIPPCFL